MTREERKRPALGDERRAGYGLRRTKRGGAGLARSRIATALATWGAVVVAVTAVVVTARSLDDDPASRDALVAERATESPSPTEERRTAAPETPAQTPRPTPAPTIIEPSPDLDGVVVFVAPDGSLRLLSEGDEEQVIAEDVLHPSIHPEGDAVAFVRYDGATSEIWIWEPGGGAEVLGSRDGLVRNLEWNEDGDALFYHVQDDGDTTTVIRRYDFYWEAADTLLASEQFSSEGASIQGFDVFPDGSLAVQVVATEGSCGIYIVDADLSSAETLLDGNGECYGQPSVSPDGEQVAFITEGTDGETYVAVLDYDGRHYRELAEITQPEAEDFWPRIAWSPDSEMVLYETVEDSELVYAQAANDTAGETRRLIAYGHHPAWQ
jgi:Tol biopolymer transport system component